MAFITETWLNEKIDDAAICTDGYSIAKRERIDKLDGGVCAFIKSYIPFKILTEYNDSNLRLQA
jgi:DNA-binding GntR family transcriptional regulator